MHSLRNILDGLLVVVQASAKKIQEAFGPDVSRRPGYRQTLIEASIVTNAALAAYSLQQEFGSGDPAGLQVVYGVYLLETRQVWAPHVGGTKEIGLTAPPRDPTEFLELSNAILESDQIVLAHPLLEDILRLWQNLSNSLGCCTICQWEFLLAAANSNELICINAAGEGQRFLSMRAVRKIFIGVASSICFFAVADVLRRAPFLRTSTWPRGDILPVGTGHESSAQLYCTVERRARIHPEAVLKHG